MDTVGAIILGIVEGITEFLPISSTGHLMVTSSLLGIQEDAFITRRFSSYSIWGNSCCGGALLEKVFQEP